MTSIEIIEPGAIQSAISSSFQDKDFRPTISGILVNQHGNVLTTRNERDSGDSKPSLFWFPQGGMQPGETPEEAAAREMSEEISGVDQVDAANFIVLGGMKYVYPEGIRNYSGRGFTEGKLLVACAVEVRSVDPIANPGQHIKEVRSVSERATRLGFQFNGIVFPQYAKKATFSEVMLARAFRELTLKLTNR